jgi:hypothetical protein
MPATLILADHTGRLGNKLILFSHVIAAAEEYGCGVVNLSILPAAHYFEGLHLNPLGRYPKIFLPIDLHWLFRAFRKPIQDWIHSRRGKPPIQNRWLTVLDMENKPAYPLDSSEFSALTRQSKWIILWGYPYRCPALVKKHATKIRAFFRVRAPVAPILSREFAAAMGAGKDTLAIHIRQGDFRKWNGGQFYLSPEQTSITFSANGWDLRSENLKTWVCSDEKVPEGIFPTGSVSGVPRGLGEDLFIMSRCRRLVGGWSTLAYFCSFLGVNDFYRISGADCHLQKMDTSSLAEA